MVTITEAAKEKIIELIDSSETKVKGLRLGAEAVSPLKVDFKMAFLADDQDTSDDAVIEFEGFNVYIDADSLPNAQEANVDYVDGLMGSGFKVERAGVTPPNISGPIVDKIRQVIEERINPAVASHGGHVSLIDVKDKAVYLQLGGGCQGCGMADVTLKQGIEVMIKEAVPEIEEIYDVTDHAGGDNPYYQQSK
jgi:Fe/S biogenesis protein NfuA